LRIAVNTRLLLKDKLEGIGWFTFEVFSRIVKAHPEHEFLFFFDRSYAKEFVFADNVTPIVLFPQARHPLLFNFWFDYSVTKALKRYQADIFFSPDGMLSLKTKIPQITVIHDLNFEHYPEDLPANVTKYYKQRYPKFATIAKKIITVSEFSKKDICELYAIDSQKVVVAYNGAGKDYQPLSLNQRTEDLPKVNNGIPYFIYVGALHKRKNIHRMLAAFKALKKELSFPLEFIIVGDFLWKKDSELASICDGVKFVGRKSGKELTSLVANSLAMVYVSYFEGFGIPVLEGMKCGIPVVTSDVTSMPEVAGDAAIYVDPFSEDSIKEGLLKATSKDNFKIYREKSLVQAKRFDWDKSAEKVWSVINQEIQKI
tara:strand:+ start:9696 stop:10808 length:1113 start_codon:yes stop_codon:yes gene_type:complete